jgi:tetratricopeptide (TPR) repeat protein
MINEARIRRIVGFGVFALTLGMYIKTLAPTVTFWDCGEYIACCHQLLVPHPPGNPLFIVLGRVAAMFSVFGNPDKAFNLNLFCAIIAALSNLMAFLLVTRLVKHYYGEIKKGIDLFILYLSGVSGVLLFAFSSTYWQNSTETEVYMSLNLIMLLAIWLMLVWYDNKDRGKHMNLILLAVVYLIALSIGVHQTMIIFIPALFILLWYEDKHSIVLLFFFGCIVWINKRPLLWLFEYILMWLPKIDGTPHTLKYLMDDVGMQISTCLVLNVLLFGGLFGYEKFMQKKGHQPLIDTKILGIASIIFAIGLATHFYIPYRSLLNPGIDENDPENINNFISYLLREQYGHTSPFDRQASYPVQFGWYGTYFSWQFINMEQIAKWWPTISQNLVKILFYTILIFLGLYGMVTHVIKDRKRGLFFFGMFFIATVGFIFFLNHKVKEVRFRDYIWINSYVLFGMYAGMGIGELVKALRDKWYKWAPLSTVALAFCLIPMATQYRSHNYSNDFIAFDYAFNMLNSCEPNSLLFTNGDNDTFPLWWMQESYGLRKDIRLMNLSLLNTDWYIKQLKNQEPKVPFSWSDEQISQLNVMLYDTKAERFIPYQYNPPATVLKDKDNNVRIFYLADLAAANMLNANNWKKPVYYAVTVSDNMGFDDHAQYSIADILEKKTGFQATLEMQGLANKMLPIKAESDLFNGELTDLLANKVFEFRGILNEKGLHDSTVYKDYNQWRLMVNYMACFNRLAVYFAQKGNDLQQAGDSDGALKNYNKAADQMVKAMQIRNDIDGLMESAISVCRTANRFEDALRMVQDKLKTDPKNFDWLVYEAVLLKDMGKFEEAEEKLLALRIAYPEERDVVYTLGLMYQDEGSPEKTIEVWEDWVGKHPEDTPAKNHLDKLKDSFNNVPPTDTAQTPEPQGQ